MTAHGYDAENLLLTAGDHMGYGIALGTHAQCAGCVDTDAGIDVPGGSL